MKAPRLLMFAVALTVLPGCVIYLDHPPKRTISGQVVRADTGEPVTNASLAFLSGRKLFSLLPVDTFGIDAMAHNLRWIDSAKKEWAHQRADTNAIPTEADLLPFLAPTNRRPALSFPACPSGGKYTIGAAGEPPKCSIGGVGHTVPTD